jgi:hypothetical protein
MNYNEDEVDGGFKSSVDEEELAESLDVPEDINDFGLDEEDPDHDR